MIIHRRHNRAGKPCAAEFPVAGNTLQGFCSGCVTTGILLGLMICFTGFMTGISHAQAVTAESGPPVGWAKIRLAAADGNSDTESEDKIIIEELEDEVDIEDIHFGPPDCTYHDPEISFSPSGTQRIGPGAQFTSTVIVTNTSNTSCDLTRFDLSTSAPHGWDVELESNSLQIAPDWSTGVLDMVVTSPSQERNGSYDIRVTARNDLLSIEYTATATYLVASDDATAACTARRPLVTIPPVINRDYIGNAVDYAISVTNHDSTHCKEREFFISHKIPAALTGTFSSSSLSLLPGNTGNITLSVAPQGSIAPGDYAIQVSVTDFDETTHVTSVDRSFTIADVCTPAAPGLDLTLAGAVNNPGTTLTYTVTLFNNDNPKCTESTFDLTVTYLPEGWKEKLSTRQVTLAPGESGKATITVTASSTSLDGSYKLQMGISDALGQRHATTSMANHAGNDAKPLARNK